MTDAQLTGYMQEERALMEQYRKWQEHVKSFDALRRERIMQTFHAAGLAYEYDGCVYHNALVSAMQGRPWKGTNTRLIKRGHYLDETSGRAYHLLHDWLDRKTKELRARYF